jgi:hypothetical protein
VQVTFTTRSVNCPQVNINDIKIPVQTEAKYLGLHLDQNLTWQKHVKTKRQQLNFKTSGNVLASASQIQVICRKQTSTIEMHYKTHMDLRYTAMGLHKTMTHQNNYKIPVQSPTLNIQCTMVFLQLYSP